MSTSKSPTATRSVRIRNDGTEPYRDAYDGTTYEIPPGADRIVPFDAASLWLGDPRTQDLGPRDKWRTEEYERITHRMGMAEVGPDEFAERRPKLSVWNPDNGERMVMVADDPSGPGQDVFRSGVDEDNPLARMARLEQAVKAVASADQTGALAAALSELGLSSPTPATSPVTPATAPELPVDAPAVSPVAPGA